MLNGTKKMKGKTIPTAEKDETLLEGRSGNPLSAFNPKLPPKSGATLGETQWGELEANSGLKDKPRFNPKKA